MNQPFEAFRDYAYIPHTGMAHSVGEHINLDLGYCKDIPCKILQIKVDMDLFRINYELTMFVDDRKTRFWTTSLCKIPSKLVVDVNRLFTFQHKDAIM